MNRVRRPFRYPPVHSPFPFSSLHRNRPANMCAGLRFFLCAYLNKYVRASISSDPLATSESISARHLGTYCSTLSMYTRQEADTSLQQRRRDASPPTSSSGWYAEFTLRRCRDTAPRRVRICFMCGARRWRANGPVSSRAYWLSQLKNTASSTANTVSSKAAVSRHHSCRDFKSARKRRREAATRAELEKSTRARIASSMA
mmetsp:Transcript_31779/g.77805  ORF Transcript_31779/g.77805 Transcript_31779/m.77805 type:complete len:201 (-) Transcript_31779:352-954(-)